MKKVLIVSYFYPPTNCIASQRFGIMCKYFEKYGYEAYILTVDPSSQTDKRLDLQNFIPENRIIRIGRLKFSYACTSLAVTMIHNLIVKKGLYSRTIVPASIGWYEKVKRELDLSLLENIDIVIGSFPPIGALLTAKYIADKLHCPYIVDMRDSMTVHPDYIDSKKNCYFLDSFVEHYIYKDAAVIVPVGKGFGQQLRRRYPNKRFEVVYNGWEEHESSGSITYTKGKYLYYAGTIYEHRLDCLKLIFKALKRVWEKKDIKMYIRSTSTKGMDKQIKSLIKNEGLEEKVFLLKAANPEVVYAEQKNAYINVVLNVTREDNEYMMSGVTGKLFENIQAEPPVLAISPSGSTISKILKWTEKGIATNSISEAEAFILNPHEYKGKRNAVNFFSRKNQARIYCKIMNGILQEELR